MNEKDDRFSSLNIFLCIMMLGALYLVHQFIRSCSDRITGPPTRIEQIKNIPLEKGNARLISGENLKVKVFTPEMFKFHRQLGHVDWPQRDILGRKIFLTWSDSCNIEKKFKRILIGVFRCLRWLLFSQRNFF